MARKVLKFGGTSVGGPERILEVIGCVRESVRTNEVAGVIVSAFAGVTDQLLHLSDLASKRNSSYGEVLTDLEARHIAVAAALNCGSEAVAYVVATIAELNETLRSVYVIRECSPKTSDAILSFGERLSAFIIAGAMSAQDIRAEFVDAREIIRTDSTFRCAEVDFTATEELVRARLGSTTGMPVITGFIASDADGRTTTLGRGGSDFTAAIVGAALGVDEVEIWTDVDGIMTADPRLVPTAIPIEALTFEEAMELSHFGAKILYPPTVQPALKHGIPIRIRNTINPGFPGSLIGPASKASRLVTAISSIAKVALIRVQGAGMRGATGTARRVFGALAAHGINVILITQASSEHTICFAVQPEHSDGAVRAIEIEFQHEFARQLLDPVVAENEMSILSVVGEQMRHLPGISGRFFHALGANGINVAAIAQGSSELNISAVIEAQDRRKALSVVHDAFFLSDLRTAHLFVVGDGLIGSTLLDQLRENAAALKARYHLDLKVSGLTNTSRMGFSQDGLAAVKANQLASDADAQEANLEEFVERMLKMNLPHCVFVDCTASEAVPALYRKVLDANISVVTPNKRALAGSLAQYKNLKEVERRRTVRFLYETCVGAGLPIIGTLADLLASGDEIYRVEAVLSGTLSFLFNSYGEDSQSLASVVRKAQTMGYTEPDPRDDLSGADVGRKLLILAREIGWDLEPDDVRVESLLPDSCRGAMDLQAFYSEFERHEPSFRGKLEEARSTGGKLCYLASLEDGKASTGLAVVDARHPFNSLSGSDNIVAFTTRRYAARPLVVKGPGAGSEVTAAGVFADLIRVVQ